MKFHVPTRRRVAQRLAIPAYFRPHAGWSSIVDAAPVAGLVVMNIADGPGPLFIPEYADAIASARRAGVEVVGYVDTDNGARSHARILADIEHYRTRYEVGGYLLDRAHVTNDVVRHYYAPLHDHVKSIDDRALLILNPGTATDEVAMTVADIVIDFEGPADEYAERAESLPKWRRRYRPDRFWHIVHGIPAAGLHDVLRASRASRTGWLFATDQSINTDAPGSYLYDRLPARAMWESLQTALKCTSWH